MSFETEPNLALAQEMPSSADMSVPLRSQLAKVNGRFVEKSADRNGSPPDWPAWLRLIERKRRLLSRLTCSHGDRIPIAFLTASTCASFRLDGIDVDDSTAIAAVAHGSASKGCRSRLTQRIRNHIAILMRVASLVRIGESLKGGSVIRWYTSISCGLSSAALGDGALARLDTVVRRINSPQLRLQPALTEVARLHVQLLADPFVPSFNGILARVLLHYHLGRCGLPPICLDPIADAEFLTRESQLLSRIMTRIEATYDLFLHR
jgi:hypothetical protein